MPFETGKIYEFSNTEVVVVICNPKNPYDEGSKYMLKVSPSLIPNMLSVVWRKESYAATPKQIKQHILDAIDIARISNYADTHELRMQLPYYPILVISLKQITESIPLISRILDNYV